MFTKKLIECATQKDFFFFLLNIDNKEIKWYLVTVSVSSCLWTGETWAIFKIWGNMPSAKDWLIIELKGNYQFPYFIYVVDLSANEISERF